MTRILSIALLSAITFGALSTSPAQASDSSSVELQDLADRIDAHVDPGLLQVDELTRQAAAVAMLGASIAAHGDTQHAQDALGFLVDDLDAGVPADIAVADFLMENPEMEAGATLLRVSGGDDDEEGSWLDAFADVLDAAADLARAIDDLMECC